MPLTMSDLQALVPAIAKETREFVRDEIALAKAELRAEISVRIEGGDPTTRTLAPTWRGTWQPEISYGTNSLVNDKSALWISETPTSLRPGGPDSGWRLAIKSPR